MTEFAFEIGLYLDSENKETVATGAGNAFSTRGAKRMVSQLLPVGRIPQTYDWEEASNDEYLRDVGDYVLYLHIKAECQRNHTVQTKWDRLWINPAWQECRLRETHDLVITQPYSKQNWIPKGKA